jgi:hypothetical protein
MGDYSRVTPALYLCALLALGACAPAGGPVATATTTAVTRPLSASAVASPMAGAIKWSTQDPNANTNGNGRLAAALLKTMSAESLRGRAEVVAAASLCLVPWDYYGKVLRLNGQVAEARDLPRGGQVARDLGVEQVGELVVVADDGTRFSYVHLGSIGQTKPGQKIAVYGYVVGLTTAGEGATGKLSAPYIVGGDIQAP